MKLFRFALVLAVVVPTLICGEGSLADVSTASEDEELVGGRDVPEDRPCGFKQLLRETERPLDDYGPNVCQRRAVYMESRSECTYRRVCRRQRQSFHCWYVCRGGKKCTTYETIYTFEPVCCSGYASHVSAFVASQSADVDQVLRDEGCVVENKPIVKATCLIRTGSVQGNITITQANVTSMAEITGVVEGLEPGQHGFHIHEYGNFQEGCGDAGGHYNPFGTVHGAPDAAVRHVGDLGNIEADGSGQATISITDHMVKLNGPISVIGRSFVVHSGVDDLGLGGVPASLTTGNAGGRVGCCTISIARP